MSDSHGTTVHLRVFVEASQGSRKSREDYTAVTIGPQHDSECFFAVFDGHGGHQAASWLGKISGKLFRNKTTSIPMTLKKLERLSNARLSKYIQLCGKKEVGLY